MMDTNTKKKKKRRNYFCHSAGREIYHPFLILFLSNRNSSDFLPISADFAHGEIVIPQSSWSAGGFFFVKLSVILQSSYMEARV